MMRRPEAFRSQNCGLLPPIARGETAKNAIRRIMRRSFALVIFERTIV